MNDQETWTIEDEAARLIISVKSRRLMLETRARELMAENAKLKALAETCEKDYRYLGYKNFMLGGEITALKDKIAKLKAELAGAKDIAGRLPGKVVP